jgi:hypothetical protein
MERLAEVYDRAHPRARRASKRPQAARSEARPSEDQKTDPARDGLRASGRIAKRAT